MHEVAGLPLPLDIVSVAYLRAMAFGPWDRVDTAEVRRRLRRTEDLAIVVRDQRRYIADLEDQLRPHLVSAEPVEQGGLW